MPESDIRDLDGLISEPRETLDIEQKAWLDICDTEHRVTMAKEIIALANHGGGFIVIGFKELDDGSFEEDDDPPKDLTAWSQDAIQGIVARYIDPAIQCQVHHRASSPDRCRHPIIVVPGGHRSPVRAKAGSPDGKKLVPHRIYIRRPGPNSEEPKTTEEWDRLLERCVQNRQAELIDAMRLIMAGVVPGAVPTAPTLNDNLKLFTDKAIKRWNSLTGALPKKAEPRLEHGYFDFAAAIDGNVSLRSLGDLKDLILTKVRNHSGWPPFVTINRSPFDPYPMDGSVETWIGPEEDGRYSTTEHYDFWRIAPSGLFFIRAGHPEDRISRGQPTGTKLDIVWPVIRLAETILEAMYLSQAIDADSARMIIKCTWTGLKSRELISMNPMRTMLNGRTSSQESYEVSQSVDIDSISTSIPDIVYNMVSPMYELFDFFKLPKQLVVEEVKRLRDNRF